MPDVHPLLVGLGWDRQHDMELPDQVQEAVSGAEHRIALAMYPKHTFTHKYDVLRDDKSSMSPASPSDELKIIQGFWMRQGGRVKAWYYDNPNDRAVVDMQFGVGDGSTVAFQLTRTFGAGGFTFAEPVMNLNGAPIIKDNGVTKTGGGTDYTLSATGLVTFNSAPANGHSLTWTGAYYYRCRFADSMASYNEMMYALHEQKKYAFKGVLDMRI
ncbi:MAG TPA: DUF2460 domain-containing protein [Burkholderiales bacterium]|nr:DUF2460 domain-containing protein [Burkholderiales bacterium]